MSKILGFLFNRITIIVLLMLVQAAALAVSIWGLSHYFVYIYIALFVLSALTVLWIINTWINPAYKLAWTILILSLPIFGGLFYLCFGANQINKSLAVRLKRQYDKIAPLLLQDERVARRNIGAIAGAECGRCEPVLLHPSILRFTVVPEHRDPLFVTRREQV